MTQQRVVLHLDMDAFYASVEQRERPELQGKPVIIGADPEQGKGRGVVAAASYEARRYGVHSAQPISQAWRQCPEGVYLYPRFPLYREVSGQAFEMLEGSVDILEKVSIDEAYADVTERTGADFETAERLARALQRRVLDEVGLSCSIGVGPNKLVAKVASDLDKPAGLTVVRPEQVEAVLGPLPASVIPGVGPKTYAKLQAMGIETIAQLAQADPEALERRFGVWGPHVIRLAQGRDERPVDPSWDRKSVGAEVTFHDDLAPDQAREQLAGVAQEAAERLAKVGDQARTITLKVRLSDFTTFTRAKTLPVATDDAEVIGHVAEGLWDGEDISEEVRLLGVRLSNLLKGELAQVSLEAWDAIAEGQEEAVRERPASWGRVWRF